MDNNIIDVRICLGKFLHDYHCRFGEEKYYNFVSRMGEKLESEYGSDYNKDELCVMEKEYNTFFGASYAKSKFKN